MTKPSVQSSVSNRSEPWLQLHQLDITAVFLNGHLEEEVFMKQLEGFVEEGKEHLVCKLKQIANGTICLKYCPTEDMLADLLTKGIGPEKFERLRMSYGMCKQESVRRSVEEVHSLIVYKHWNHT